MSKKNKLQRIYKFSDRNDEIENEIYKLQKKINKLKNEYRHNFRTIKDLYKKAQVENIPLPYKQLCCKFDD